jgi:hypothetical protein
MAGQESNSTVGVEEKALKTAEQINMEAGKQPYNFTPSEQPTDSGVAVKEIPMISADIFNKDEMREFLERLRTGKPGDGSVPDLQLWVKCGEQTYMINANIKKAIKAGEHR